MAAISVAGLSEETVALLTRKAHERGVELGTIVRELAALGLRLELAPPAPSDPGRLSQPQARDDDDLPHVLFGPLETDDPDYLWS